MVEFEEKVVYSIKREWYVKDYVITVISGIKYSKRNKYASLTVAKPLQNDLH